MAEENWEKEKTKKLNWVPSLVIMKRTSQDSFFQEHARATRVLYIKIEKHSNYKELRAPAPSGGLNHSHTHTLATRGKLLSRLPT